MEDLINRHKELEHKYHVVSTQMKSSYLLFDFSRNVLFQQLPGLKAFVQFLVRTKQVCRKTLRQTAKLIRQYTTAYPSL